MMRCLFDRIAASFLLVCGLAVTDCRSTSLPASLLDALGRQNALIAVRLDGEILLAHRADEKMIPASTLKLLTALVALHEFGSDYRFPTDFFYDEHRDLTVKGYGDPLLISETIPDVARSLSARIAHIDTIILDDSYFADPMPIPGARFSSIEPYDAPVGALCVNFNSVFFETDTDGRLVSAEPQTPLLPMAIPRIKASGLKEGRIILLQKNHEPTFYTGQLLGHFFKEAGIAWQGHLTRSDGRRHAGNLIMRHRSPYTLTDIIAKMLYFSNNFIANQLFLSAGAKRQGAPATLEKGIDTALRFASEKLGITDIELVEGSGLSRKNRTSARTLAELLIAFSPYRKLMRFENGIYSKTGTLSDVRSRVGYLEDSAGQIVAFAVIINTPGRSDRPVVDRLRAYVRDR